MTCSRGVHLVSAIKSSIHTLIAKHNAAIAREIIRETVHIVLATTAGNFALKGTVLENGEMVESAPGCPAVVRFPSCSDIRVKATIAKSSG